MKPFITKFIHTQDSRGEEMPVQLEYNVQAESSVIRGSTQKAIECSHAHIELTGSMMTRVLQDPSQDEPTDPS